MHAYILTHRVQNTERLISNEDHVSFLDSRAVSALQGSTQGHWRFPAKRVEAGHAYILTHPGTPAIFWDHWRDAKLRKPIQRLIKLRREQGINCRSAADIQKCVFRFFIYHLSCIISLFIIFLFSK